MSIKTLWENLQGTPAFRPVSLAIPPERVDIGKRLDVPFKRNEEYFLVRINEMFLSYRRKWFSIYDPVVYVLSEFSYDRERFQVPFVLGPSMLKGKIEIPKQGMLFKNTSVAGLHPFKGDSFALSVVLCRTRQEDYLRKLLQFIEKTSATYSTTFATAVSSYSKVAHVILDSIDELLGSTDVEPLIGQRQEYITSVGDRFASGYYALVNLAENDIEAEKLFIKNDTLCYGDSLATALPFRSDDYVLYSILSTKERDDFDKFDFAQEFDKLKTLLGDIKEELSDEQRTMVNNQFIGVKGMVRNSPDLVRSQTEAIIAEYTSLIQAMLHDRVSLSRGGLQPQKDKRDEWEQKLDKMVNDNLKF